MDHKAPDAFRSISEVADELDLPQHVLRFWESRFRDIKPMKRGGGRRYYRPDDVDLLRGIRHLLYGEGYTIRGVQRILREQGAQIRCRSSGRKARRSRRMAQATTRISPRKPSPRRPRCSRRSSGLRGRLTSLHRPRSRRPPGRRRGAPRAAAHRARRCRASSRPTARSMAPDEPPPGNANRLMPPAGGRSRPRLAARARRPAQAARRAA